MRRVNRLTTERRSLLLSPGHGASRPPSLDTHLHKFPALPAAISPFPPRSATQSHTLQPRRSLHALPPRKVPATHARAEGTGEERATLRVSASPLRRPPVGQLDPSLLLFALAVSAHSAGVSAGSALRGSQQQFRVGARCAAVHLTTRSVTAAAASMHKL